MRRHARTWRQRMPKNEPKPARRPPEADELTVQYMVPRELLRELAAADDEKTRVASLADAFQEEQTLLMLPTADAPPVLTAPSVASPPRSAPSPLRPMTPVTISDAEVNALLRPRRMARLAGVGLLLVLALVAIAIAIASR